jgi:protease I
VAHKTVPHLVWGRVVPDIPDFCRELVAALAEE